MTITRSIEVVPNTKISTDIHLGIRHRRAASLIQEFYPDGMPEDWRHSYLAMMTQVIWVEDGDDDLAEMLAAIVDAPKPVLTVWVAEDSAQANLWQAAHPEQQLIIMTPSTPVWTPQAEGGGGARVALMPGSDQPAQIRAWLEQFVQQAPAGPCALFVDGESPSVPTLDRLQTLIELMGL
ncbi:hypothetical protein [Halothiobacillus neapolitanus]|uniref:Uncharacterized protein n=1 Tax=Halothiobacillus neapolitanus (strain ATCC 23641 / DSM 15147 / CIP 104769 / NCIMB 8539 / c2) TaxID=555778 RepID=D0KYT4_HALNC|nr:hypothetical protein [Halothiobacillus neapolitanus]ACX95607.1 hypothetical protein Hneap_0758 [Halothiobacillus neapolitanus c2]TDN65909.1 hypothetical protein C8D83_101223 [Halothiobacillus neapolitanus]